MHRHHRNLMLAVGIILGTVLYLTFLFTYYAALRFSVLNLVALWNIGNLIVFYSSAKNYVSELVNRICKTLIAFSYAIIVHIAILIIYYFIVQIFALRFIQTDMLFMFSFDLSIGSFVWFIVLFSDKSRTDWHPGTFFNTLFGTIIPKLSIVSGVLAIIYMIQVFFNYREDISLLTTYYPFIVVFYMTFIFSYCCRTRQKEQRLVNCLFIVLTMISIAFILKRQITIPSQQYSSLYALIVNGIFLVYNMYLFFKTKTVTIHLSFVAAAIAIIVFLPIFGYSSYTAFTTYTKYNNELIPEYSLEKIFALKLKTNSLEDFYSKNDHKQQPVPNTIDRVDFYTADKPTDISISLYKNMRTDAIIDSDNAYTYRNLNIVPSDNGKTFDIFANDIQDKTVSIYDMAKTSKVDDSPLMIQGEGYLLIIYKYSYQKNGSRITHNMQFSILTDK